MKKPWHKLRQIQPALSRHLLTTNNEPYERILQYVRGRSDIWVTSQGEFVLWWQRRENSSLKITVADGMGRVETSLDDGVAEKFPGTFLDSPLVRCPETDFSGEVLITIDRAIQKRDLLIEILKREGILNFTVADHGDFFLANDELEMLLDEIDARRTKRLGRLQEDDIRTVRLIVSGKLARRNLPLFRLWYHPRLQGQVMRAVFSPRHDVDRAITNLAGIRALELKYDAPSTLYVRAFCPFYTEREVAELAARPWCSEIALHGEFVTNARAYDDEITAAQAEKVHLERAAGRSILGVAMHGGELANNRSDDTEAALQAAGLLYDTTPRPARYYFPFRKVVNGQVSTAFSLGHALSDVNVASNRDYGRAFYERAVAKMDEIYAQHGVFVLLLHPVYFGFLAYLSRPRNWPPLAKFMWGYLNQSSVFSHQ